MTLLLLGCVEGFVRGGSGGGVDGVFVPDTQDTAGPGVCGQVSTIEDGRTPTRTVTIEPGEDIAAAAAGAQPGDALLLAPGVHTPATVYDLSGTAEAPIWLGGEGAVIEGGSEALHLVRPRYLILHDLEVSGAEDNGINVDDGGDYDQTEAARDLLFRDLHVHDVGSGGNQDCLKLSGLRDYVVMDSTFERCSSSAIDHVGCHDGLIVGNHIEDAGRHGVQSKGGSTGIVIARNTFGDAGDRSVNLGGSTGKEFFRPPLTEGENAEARDLLVVANHFQGSEAPIAYVGCTDCVVANNTILEPGNWVMRILQETLSDEDHDFATVSGGVFENNLVVWNASELSRTVNIGPDTDPQSFVFANDLWYAQDAPESSEPELPANEPGAVIGVDPQLDGLRPSADSPALGAGTTARTDADLYGACFLDPPAIGAAEWSSD